jgi:hypothetical protein
VGNIQKMNRNFPAKRMKKIEIYNLLLIQIDKGRLHGRRQAGTGRLPAAGVEMYIQN